MMLLYEADSKGISASDVLAAQISDTDELTTLLVEGVEQNQRSTRGVGRWHGCRQSIALFSE